MAALDGAVAGPSAEGMTFEAWVASKGDTIGEKGTRGILTPLAARELWDTLAEGEGWMDSRRLKVIDATLARDVRSRRSQVVSGISLASFGRHRSSGETSDGVPVAPARPEGSARR